MGADVVRHKKIRTAVYDEYGNLLKYEEREIELHEKPMKRRNAKASHAKKPPARPKAPHLLPLKPAHNRPTHAPKKPEKWTSPSGPSRSTSFCQYCQEDMPVGEFQAHCASERHNEAVKAVKARGGLKFGLKHPRNPLAKAPRETKKHEGVLVEGPKPMRRCPRCNELVPRGKMLEHKIQRHHEQPGVIHQLKSSKIHTKPDAQSKPQSFNDPKSFVACQVCGVSVRNDHLAKHICKAHQQAQAKRKGAQGKAGKALAKDGTDAAFEHSRIEREEDGSKNIGYLARERGRFGSHPMHDDYADEGGAD